MTNDWQLEYNNNEKIRNLSKRFDLFETIDWTKEILIENQNYYNDLKKHNNDINSDIEMIDLPASSVGSEPPSTPLSSTLEILTNKVSNLTIIKSRIFINFQIWILLTIIGVLIGSIAASLNIITDWLGDFKSGYCKESFYLNKRFCCWEEDLDKCSNWEVWSKNLVFKYLIHIFFCCLFGLISAILCRRFAKNASGSGISEVKCIVNGFKMSGFLDWWTLLIKSLALPLTIASGLQVGKEGPSVHYSACVGNVIPKFLISYFEKSFINISQFITASTAAGVAVAFGSPIGGVLFSIEEINSEFKLSTLWKSYYCALISVSVLNGWNPFRTGQIVMFEVKYDIDWKWIELPFFIVLGLFGGFYGVLISRWNIKCVSFRQRYLANHGVKEVFYLCLITGMVGYFNEYIRLDMTKVMENLFSECKNSSNHSCLKSESISSNLEFIKILLNLLIATILRSFFICISYGSKVPCGIFVPSMAVGATFGKALGLIVERIFESKNIEITSGTYAFLGAGATLSGITGLTVTVVVIMFELTGAIKYILPMMIVIVMVKIINEIYGIGFGGIADQMIKFNGLPFIDSNEEYKFKKNYKAINLMCNSVVGINNIIKVDELKNILNKTSFKNYPIVINKNIIVGMIERKDLLRGLIDYNLIKEEGNHNDNENADDENKTIIFLKNESIKNLLNGSDYNDYKFKDLPKNEALSLINFERLISFEIFKIDIKTSIYSILEIFIKLGPKICFVEKNNKLVGLLTKKDLIRFELYSNYKTFGNKFLIDYDEILFNRFWNFLLRVNERLNFIKVSLLRLIGIGSGSDSVGGVYVNINQ